MYNNLMLNQVLRRPILKPRVTMDSLRPKYADLEEDQKIYHDPKITKKYNTNEFQRFKKNFFEKFREAALTTCGWGVALTLAKLKSFWSALF